MPRPSDSKPRRSPSLRHAALRQRAQDIFKTLHQQYPEAKCALVHRNAFELLVATILSAQCTDVRVNMVTPALFARYPSPEAFARASLPDLEQAIRSTGFYRNKAKNIQAASRLIVERFGGSVPSTMLQLLELPGVARKTANVVLGNAFQKDEGVVVDTHVGRLSVRLGLSKHSDPVKVERDLMALYDPQQWTMLAHLLIEHGRKICTARAPKCQTCPVRDLCPKVGVAASGGAGKRATGRQEARD